MCLPFFIFLLSYHKNSHSQSPIWTLRVGILLYQEVRGLSCDDADGGGVLGGADKVDAVGKG